MVKGVHFGDLRQAGDPVALARRYAADGIDELVVLDITATLEGRRALLETIRAVARELFVPLTVGGGIRTREDARAVIEAGADKVSINSAALADPGLITALAEVYGSQAVVVAIDAKGAARLEAKLGPEAGADRFQVFTRSARRPSRVTRWPGRKRLKRAAPARSSSPPSTATARGPVSTAS